jgi:hypothetical protein
VIEQTWLADVLLELRKLKSSAERATAQIDPEQLFFVLDPEANSIAVLMKHMAGNMRSRWTDFLASDGEKPDRRRDQEFIITGADTPEHLKGLWEDGWKRVFDAIGALGPEDLGRTVKVRGEPHTVVEAINRQLSHYAMHVGQIVLLAKHFAGPGWRTLTVPRGRSSDFDVSRSGAPYRIGGGPG